MQTETAKPCLRLYSSSSNFLVPCDDVSKSDAKQQETRGIQLGPECVMTYFRVANSQYPSSKSWPYSLEFSEVLRAHAPLLQIS